MQQRPRPMPAPPPRKSHATSGSVTALTPTQTSSAPLSEAAGFDFCGVRVVPARAPARACSVAPSELCRPSAPSSAGAGSAMPPGPTHAAAPCGAAPSRPAAAIHRPTPPPKRLRPRTRPRLAALLPRRPMRPQPQQSRARGVGSGWRTARPYTEGAASTTALSLTTQLLQDEDDVRGPRPKAARNGPQAAGSRRLKGEWPGRRLAADQ